MNDFKSRLTHLLHCRGMGWTTILNILKADPELQSLYNLSSKQLALLLPVNTVTSVLEDLHSHVISDKIRQYPHNGIKMITIFDQQYPLSLKEIYQPPWILYAKGNLQILEANPKLAVVGSREPTAYGKNAIDFIFPKLIDKGIVIVSGLAKGIDRLAHLAAINHHGSTIGVIAGGFYHIYPRENIELASQMMRHQLVISEYPPETRPSRWQFPMRNRIISGISQGTFIIEAKRKSGSLITASAAVNEGREVFALPGSIFGTNSIGTNELIQQGAKLVLTHEDILDELFYR